MSLSRKFVIVLISCICSIAILNIAAFYVFYNSYIRLYLSDKISSRENVTIEYINDIIERQAVEDADNIFSDVQFQFFELLDINEGSIPLSEWENMNIVVDFLVRSWVSAKYIEEIIPENNLEKVLDLMKDPSSPERLFVKRLFISMVLTNALILLNMAAGIFIFTRRIIHPIKKATSQIEKLQVGKKDELIEYPKMDEIGLLIESINALNSKLSVQEKIRSRLLADISHELKTPITSIQCYLEGISDGIIELTPENLSSITSEMTRLTELVNKIMEYEKFENTELELNKSVENPYKLIESIAETQRIYLQDTKQEIILEGSRNIELSLDKDLFTQLVYNLITNFIKYAGKKATLSIKITSKKITFSDDGEWIAKKEVPYLFEKFYQGKKEKTGDIKSRGIWVGLSIVKKVIEAHNWQVVVRSDTKKGFKFIINL